MTGNSGQDGSRLTVRPRPRFWTRRFAWSFTPVACVAVAGMVWLALSGNLLVPFQPVTTLEGKMASKADLFEDDKFQRLLLADGIYVHVTRTGSRAIATHDIERFDFVLPSGRPAANLIIGERNRNNKYLQIKRLFVSPVVLATYREYAETLVSSGVAAPQGRARGLPLYYTLDTAKFLDLISQEKTWNDIDIGRHKGVHGESITNGNRVLAHSSNVCTSNSSGTYLALVAFVANGEGIPASDREATALAERIKPLLTAQGMPELELFKSYVTPEGKGEGPIVVVYEHQYLAYQVQYQQRNGRPDTERVLLYPKQEFQTHPEFIALNERGERLGQLLATDPDLQRRAMELGFRILDATGSTGSDQLARFLADRHIPPPRQGSDYTKAELPLLPQLEKMITIVGECAR
jgi:hypothetical protein